MSRIANAPVVIPSGVEVTLKGQALSVKGPKGSLDLDVHGSVKIEQVDSELRFAAKGAKKEFIAMAGTMRSLANNLVTGVTTGYEKKLQLVGVGYRAVVKGKFLNLSLGFSHPIDYPIPEGIKIEAPSATEVNVSGISKQLVGQVSAEIRDFRKPEPYKGKGVKYVDEIIVRKEAKKK